MKFRKITEPEVPNYALQNEFKILKMNRLEKGLIKILKVDFLVGESAVRNWVIIGLGVLVGIVMIFNSHSVEQKVHTRARLINQVKELQSEFVDVRSKLQRIRLESTVLQSLKESGLKQSETPPQKIKVIIKQ